MTDEKVAEIVKVKRQLAEQRLELDALIAVRDAKPRTGATNWDWLGGTITLTSGKDFLAPSLRIQLDGEHALEPICRIFLDRAIAATEVLIAEAEARFKAL